MNGSIIVASTKSDDVHRLLEDKLVPVMAGQPLAVAAAAMLMLIVTSMKPDIEGDDLVECITGASGWIVMFLSELGEPHLVN